MRGGTPGKGTFGEVPGAGVGDDGSTVTPAPMLTPCVRPSGCSGDRGGGSVWPVRARGLIALEVCACDCVTPRATPFRCHQDTMTLRAAVPPSPPPLRPRPLTCGPSLKSGSCCSLPRLIPICAPGVCLGVKIQSPSVSPFSTFHLPGATLNSTLFSPRTGRGLRNPLSPQSIQRPPPHHTHTAQRVNTE